LANTTNRVPIEECGERQLYLATSARFPPLKSSTAAVTLEDGIEVALGTNGEVGSGVYSVEWDCEVASAEVRELLAGLREKGMVEQAWEHTQKEFERITASDCSP
jgi:predicted deacylase